MRWEQLFGDLEARLEAGERRDLALEVADRARRERATLGLHERLMARRGEEVRLWLVGGHTVVGRVVDAGADWVLLIEPPRREALVPFAAIVGVRGLTGQAAAGEAAVTAKRFGFGYALRGLSRDRAVVLLADIGGATTTGTVDAVGSDAIDLSEHPVDLPRRSANLLGRRVVPFSAIAVVRTA